MKSSGWWVSFFCVFAAVAIWSTSFAATKIALSSFPPLTLAAARLSLATLLLGLMALARNELVPPRKQDFSRIALGGLLGITAYFALENYGIQLASATDGALLVGSFPVITLLLESLLFRIRLSWKRAMGTLTAMAGVFIIVGMDATTYGEWRLLGDILLILTGITWALYNFVTKTVIQDCPLMTLNFYQSLVGTVAFYPFVFAEWGSGNPVSTSALLGVLYLGVVCSVAAYLLYTYGLRKLDSTSAVSLMNLIPVLGVCFSVALLGETVSAYQIVGGLVILVGVSLSVQRKQA